MLLSQVNLKKRKTPKQRALEELKTTYFENTDIEIFPFSVVAMMLGFKDVYPFFEVEDSDKENIDVNAFFNKK